MTIKHIVLAGGAYNGLYTIGVINYLLEENILDLQKIESVYGTSVGALIGVLICLECDWATMLNYIIHRPWEKVLHVEPDMILNMIANKGILDDAFFKTFYSNIFLAKNISLDITLKDFYEETNKKFNIFATDVNSLEVYKMNYKDTPDIKLIDAVYASCALPFIFKPKTINDKLLIDGGINYNYPLDFCINNGALKNEVMGIDIRTNIKSKVHINENTNILYFGFHLFTSLIYKNIQRPTHKIKNEVIIPCQPTNIESAIEIVKNKQKRQEMILKGEEYGKLFLTYKEINNLDSNNVSDPDPDPDSDPDSDTEKES